MDAVCRFALRLTRDPNRAQDLTQDTFLRAFQSWERYEPGTRARSWLFTICRNLFLRGEERRHREILSEVAEEDPRRLSREANVLMAVRDRHPEGAFWGNVVDDEILKAIEELPASFRKAVVLSDLEDLAYDEIAGVLGVPAGTVKSRLFRRRKMLQRRLYGCAVSEGIIPSSAAIHTNPDPDTAA